VLAYYGCRKIGDAIADCNQALSLKPNFAGSYFNRGRARAALKDKKGALRIIRKPQNSSKAGKQEKLPAVLEEIRKA
jgi:tetratricopeptide (TPR) repeat protein